MEIQGHFWPRLKIIWFSIPRDMLLTALDILEMRGLPRDVNLLPKSEVDPTSAGSASGPEAATRAGLQDIAAGSAEVLACNAKAEDEEMSIEPYQETTAANAGAGAPPDSQSLLGPGCCASGPSSSTLRHTRSTYDISGERPRRNSRLVNARLANHSASFTFKPRCASPEARQRFYSNGRRHSASFPGADARRAKTLLVGHSLAVEPGEPKDLEDGEARIC